MGARIEPWGTPQESSAGIEEKLPNLTEKLLLAKYDLNQLIINSLDAHKQCLGGGGGGNALQVTQVT